MGFRSTKWAVIWIVGAFALGALGGTSNSSEGGSQACIRALDLASEGFDVASRMLNVERQAVLAAAASDASMLHAATNKLESLTQETEDLNERIKPEAAACRGHQ
jgi:hypothetical protein